MLTKNIFQITTLIKISILFIFIGCSKTDDDLVIIDENQEPVEIIYSSDKPYNLNIIYFAPSDNPPIGRYEERLSKILINTQDYFGKWMTHWGYPNTSFGLLTDSNNTKVKITKIIGKLTKDQYPYDGGYPKIIAEIKAHFSSTSNAPSSDHYLVIMPNARDDGGYGGVPFYGVGRYCFALDAGVDMTWGNLGTSGDIGTQAGWIGGLIHELGHGLNLPHTSHKTSEFATFGASLMNYGNHEISKGKIDKTFLTASDAAILSQCQVFATENKKFYEPVVASIPNISAIFENGKLLVSGTFESDVEVAKVIVNQDPEGHSNYDQIGWIANLNGNTFSISMPSSELMINSNNIVYYLNIRLVFTNGTTLKTKIIEYTYNNGETDLNLNISKIETVDRSNWEVISYSSQEPSYGEDNASDCIDGDVNTFWHSGWSNPLPGADHPHTLTIDMGDQINVNGFQFTQRQTLQRSIKGLEIETSTDGTTWSSIGSIELSNILLPQSVQIDALPKTFRYFRLKTESSWDNEKSAALAEVEVF